MQNTPTPAQIRFALTAALDMLKGVDLATYDVAEFVPLVRAVKDIGAFGATVHIEIERRVLANGEMLPGVSTKDEVKHRQWHDIDAATQLAREEFGDDAFSKPALMSPAQIEKLGPKGKQFVAVASYKPEAGKKVVY
jgi:hypothetical protein